MNCLLEAGNEVWVIQYNGPTCCIFVQHFEESNKCVVVFHGVPLIADEADCFADRDVCYHEAAQRKQGEALAAMGLVQEYIKLAAAGEEGKDDET